jgi:L-fucose isomerase-like protein
MDSFKMIDEISLVEYSDEETADSEQLESFRKFCEEQNSEGGQESTPSASNTESAY